MDKGYSALEEEEGLFEEDEDRFRQLSMKSEKQEKPTKEEKLTWKKFVAKNSKAVPVVVGSVIIAIALLVCFGWLGTWTYVNRNQRQIRYPIVLTTWNFRNATATAFNTIQTKNMTALDAVEQGCNFCENNPDQCDYTVGYGGSPNDLGETTLDAMIMWAPTAEVGAVGCLKRVKNAISVARKVMELTDHTLLVGDDATSFATEVGFVSQSLTTQRSTDVYNAWLNRTCTPNFWQDPDFAVCPPLNGTPPTPVAPSFSSNVAEPLGSSALEPQRSFAAKGTMRTKTGKRVSSGAAADPGNHDTIGMVAIDNDGQMACGTSSNGLQFKIHGRVGDSPIPGAGAYCDQEIGGAAASGDGDVMMRFLPSLKAVEEMRRGATPQSAAERALQSILKYYPEANAAIVVLSKSGKMGAASIGFQQFTYNYQRGKDTEPTIHTVESFNGEH